jgi:hypothetical protein
MRFLEQNEIDEWREEHGLRADYPRESSVVERIVFAQGRRSGRERHVAEDCIRKLGEWSHALLIVLEWGIWPSSEDWPAYYAARGAQGEKRSLGEAPGHLFEWSERELLLSFLTAAMEFGWNAEVIAASGERALSRGLFVSHDEWIEIREAR